MKKHLLTLGIALLACVLYQSAIETVRQVARADQSERVVPTTGIYTGPEYAQLIGDLARSVSTANKGSSAPANVSGTAVDGLEWLDDTTTPWVMKRYINGGWVEEAAYDPTGTPSYIGLIGGGGIGSVASASVTDLSSVKQSNVSITGTTTITSFGSSAPTGAIKFISFAGALTLTYSSALPVPCGYDLVTAANDRAVVTHLGSGNWAFNSYQRANGIPVDCSAVGKLSFNIGAVPSLHLAGYGQAVTRTSYPAYVAKVTRAQNGTRTNGNATITSVADTTGMGAGMPVEGTGINSSCTIASVTSSTIVLNSASCVTSSGTSTVTVFLTGYGSGGSSSTVGIPDCRGRGIAGRDRDDPGSFANRMTTSYFGSDSKVFNVANGSESHTLTTSEMPSHNHAVFLNDPGHTHNVNAVNGTGGSGFASGAGLASAVTIASTSATTGLTVRDTTGGGGTANQTATTGSGSAHAIMPPTLVAECSIRVTP